MLRRVIAILLAAMSISTLFVSTSYADGSCEHHNRRSGGCWGDGGGGPQKGPGSGGRGKTTPIGCVDSTFSRPARTLPCSGPFGNWSNDYQCYLKLYDGEPTDARLSRRFHCYAPPYAGGVDRSVVNIIYGGPQVDPQTVAREVAASLQLHAVHMGLAPRAGSTGLVQLPVWMWAAEPDLHTWGPVSASKTKQGLTVVVTAKVNTVDWDMGDGTTVTCGVGTLRPAGGGSSPSPDCGHTYTSTSASRYGGSFTVTATSHWAITWVAGTEHGSFPFELSDTAQLTMIESRPVLTAP